MAEEKQRERLEEIRRKNIEIKSTSTPLIRNGLKFQTGHWDYDQSRELCKACNGKYKKVGKIFLDEEYQEIPICTAIAIPLLEDLCQTPDELKQKLKDLCLHTGEIRNFQHIIKGYLPGPYTECQRSE